MKVAVIGAGPAGMTAAYQLAKGGASVEVFEAGDRVGGLARSLDLWGQRVDMGPHRFFSSDARVNRLWLEVVERDYAMVDRLTRIYYKKRFFLYPLKPANALWNLGFFEAARCIFSYFREKVSHTAPDAPTFESWVVRRFGRRLFEIFFKTYSEKLWGIGCDQLDADFAAQRIKKLSLWEAVKNALKIGGKGHKTLVDRFAYPLRGTGSVYEKMKEKVESWGGRVRLRCPVRRVLNEGRVVRALELESGENLAFDHVVSTMPLTLLVRELGDLPNGVRDAVGRLTYRNTILVYLNIRSTELFPDQWIYVHSPDLNTGRVTNFRNWVPQLYGDARSSIVMLEFWCYDEDPIWSESDERLIERGRTEMRSTGLIGDAEIAEGHVVRIKRCYPVYRLGYKEVLDVIVPYLRTFSNLTPIGRYGAFKYNNQDHSILMGLLAAENILEGKTHDLWAVNTDYESYQEAAVITETGLATVG
jgi:protoporphyrinogen oxidase